MTDVSVIDDGTLVTFIPLSPEAKKVFRHTIVEPFQIRPDGSILIDASGARDFVQELLSEDLELEGTDSLLN